MNKTIEVEGKTIDQAIEKACQEFNLPRGKLNIEILSEGSSGFLGLVGAKKARVRASLMTFDMNFDGTFKEISREIKTEAQPDVSHLSPKEENIKQEETTANNAGTQAQDILDGILKRMALDFPIELEETDDSVSLNIIGDGSGLLIGKGGQTLDALQYYLNKVLNKNGQSRKRIIVDTENYRRKREQTLITLAEKLAEKAKKIKKPVIVNPMNAHDRRIIHMALQNDSDLTTKSRGEGAFRKIIIVPGKK